MHLLILAAGWSYEAYTVLQGFSTASLSQHLLICNAVELADPLSAQSMRHLLVKGLNEAIEPETHFAPRRSAERSEEYRSRMKQALFCCVRYVTMAQT